MKKLSRGFTLIELMITLAIAAVLMTVAVPAMTSLVNSRALVGQLTNINNDLRFARAEAVGQSGDVIICVSTDGATCSGGNDWDSGWIIYFDRNSNNQPDFGTGTCDVNEDCLLKVQEPMTAGMTLRGTSSFRFDNLGGLSSAAGSLSLCRNDADSANDTDRSRTLNVQATGSIFVTMGAAACPT